MSIYNHEDTLYLREPLYKNSSISLVKSSDYNAIIENFDIEVRDKIRSLENQLRFDIDELMLKAECEIQELPTKVKNMKLKDFITKYNGDISKVALEPTFDFPSSLRIPEIPPALKKL
ncbi:hypothetical protein BB558_003865 [Smittium angustum]|nr:hypothetical protein BB558_003865 [Smittium angustum]